MSKNLRQKFLAYSDLQKEAETVDVINFLYVPLNSYFHEKLILWHIMKLLTV